MPNSGSRAETVGRQLAAMEAALGEPPVVCDRKVKHLGGGAFELLPAQDPEVPPVVPRSSRELTPVALLTLGFLLGLGLLGVAAFAARRRPRWRAALVVALALLPAAAGLALAWQALGELWSSLHQPAFCLPREQMASVGLASVRHQLGAGLVATVALLLVALALGYEGLRRGVGRPLLLPLSVLLGLGLGAGATLGRVRRVQASLDAPLAVLRSADAPLLARVANLPPPPPSALPDLPLVLVGADGPARYDDSRGQEPPGPLPPLLGWSGEASPPGDEAPSEMLLVVDGRATFGALRAALAPLREKNFDHFRFVFARAGRGPERIQDLGWLTFPLRPPHYRWSRVRFEPRYTSSPHVFLDASGARVQMQHIPLGAGCDPSAPPPTVPRQGGVIDMAALRACLRKLKDSSPDFKEDTEAWLLPDGATPWSEVAAVIDLLLARDDDIPLYPDISLGFLSPDVSRFERTTGILDYRQALEALGGHDDVGPGLRR